MNKVSDVRDKESSLIREYTWEHDCSNKVYSSNSMKLGRNVTNETTRRWSLSSEASWVAAGDDKFSATTRPRSK